MVLFIQIICWLLLGYWCYSIAEKNGRDKILAAFLGILFGIFAVIGYYIIGKSPEKRKEEAEKMITTLTKKIIKKSIKKSK